MTAVYSKRRALTVSAGGTAATPQSNVSVQESPVFHVYAQDLSLNKIDYFGLGQDTSDTARAFYGMREAIVGANVVWPLWRALNLSVYGEANGRFVDIRGNHTGTSPSLGLAYSEATAPGLTNQPVFGQFGEGIRLRPSLPGGYLRLNYNLVFQQYVAGTSTYSFRRFTSDLNHTIPLYRTTRTLLPHDFNGPDDCSIDPSVHKCPSVSRNLEGSLSFRFLYSKSFVTGGNVVPFYFDPTLGGSDINGAPWLASYQDYRFRGPNLIALRGSFEHSIYGPLGASFTFDTGKVALQNEDLDLTHLAHSFSAGLTLRAGGLPMIYLLFAWGGHEGTHTIAQMNTSLLGGATRPSLY